MSNKTAIEWTEVAQKRCFILHHVARRELQRVVKFLFELIPFELDVMVNRVRDLIKCGYQIVALSTLQTWLDEKREGGSYAIYGSKHII